MLLLPTHRKLDLLLLGGVVVVICACIGLYVMFSDHTAKPQPAKAVTATASSLQKDFKQPLEIAQQGNVTQALVQGKFLIIDIRSLQDYNQAHIEGSLPSKASQLKGAEFQPGTTLIIYSQSSDDIDMALTTLGQKGFTQVQVLNEPLDSLEKAGYKIVRATP